MISLVDPGMKGRVSLKPQSSRRRVGRQFFFYFMFMLALSFCALGATAAPATNQRDGGNRNVNAHLSPVADEASALPPPPPMLSATQPRTTPSMAHPNVVIIMADDLGGNNSSFTTLFYTFTMHITCAQRAFPHPFILCVYRL